jgi:RNA 3'-terminal phosphate cyclase (ATP)
MEYWVPEKTQHSTTPLLQHSSDFMLTIDGSYNEGGGQILRTALTLSLATRTPFRIEKIRAGRKRPGLLRQHLTAVEAARRIGAAEIRGAEVNSQELAFVPQDVIPGDYHFSIGTAGSTTLVLQTVLPVLMLASKPSTLTLEGGTHNPAAPPYDFIERVYVPLLNRLGAQVQTQLIMAGFFPAGGGKLTVAIEPPSELRPLELTSRGDIRQRSARALVANLPRSIAERELAVVERKLGWEASNMTAEIVPSHGPGNIVLLEVECTSVTEVFTGFGERNVRAEIVADRVVTETRQYLAANVAAGQHLADQLLVPMALMRGGIFTTLPLSRHSETNIDTIAKFISAKIRVGTENNRSCVVEVAV